ncbi:MAG: ATP-binding protein, partial [Desulfobacteraceae bacterium]
MKESKREFARVYRVVGDSVSGYLIPGREALVQSHFSGVHEIARVGHYVAIPIGADLAIGIVTSLKVEEHEPLAKRQESQSLGQEIWRIIDISLVGTIVPENDGTEVKRKFQRGVLNYPTIDDPIWFITQEELETIFGLEAQEDAHKYIWIASLASNNSLRVCLNINKLFGTHSAVLGSTGAGKSCTVAAIIHNILNANKDGRLLFPSARFLVLDINGEYGHAFSGRRDCAVYKVKRPAAGEKDCITIPYWLFNFQEFRLLFTPSAQTQLPRLRAAIQFLRTNPDGYDEDWTTLESVLTGPDLQDPFDAVQGFFQNSQNRSADDPSFFPCDKLIHII